MPRILGDFCRLALPRCWCSCYIRPHFRRAALDEVGGWDAYNVTEDAELGVRLARYGYRTGVITRPTWEDAPETLAVWLPQRIRWFKGWMRRVVKSYNNLKKREKWILLTLELYHSNIIATNQVDISGPQWAKLATSTTREPARQYPQLDLVPELGR